jgi:hypothetical protein
MLHPHKIKQFFIWNPAGEKLWVLIMGDEISEHSITFCWEDACQQHAVQNIMGSRG